jgi:hypothetical protein
MEWERAGEGQRGRERVAEGVEGARGLRKAQGADAILPGMVC